MQGIRRKSTLILFAAALPLAIGGCSSADSPSPSATEDRSGTDWINTDAGKRTPSPTTRYGTASPTPEVTLPTLATNTSPTAKASPSCTTPPKGAGGINGLDVRPSSTSAIVTWYHPGGGNIVDYRVTAFSQDLIAGEQEPVGWATVTPVTCGDLSATVTGLTPATHYIFVVDKVMTHASGVDGTYAKTVARSGVVSTT
ncbi:fibronectin type III domain-containing protein [Actinoplanes sp. CA-015351]|uniref:fibronectin type III domain-containing protein n=1 Tax=Actinoplanes sp. CA-015351 TaxID=3239897 RepID=UPI003D98D7A5